MQVSSVIKKREITFKVINSYLDDLLYLTNYQFTLKMDFQRTTQNSERYQQKTTQALLLTIEH